MQFAQRIGTDDEVKLRTWFTLSEFHERVDAVRGAAAAKFDIVGLELWIAADGQPYHCQPLRSSRIAFVTFVRRHTGRNKLHTIQPQLLHRILRHEQMTEVNRVERAAKDADLFAFFHEDGLRLIRANSFLKPFPRSG